MLNKLSATELHNQCYFICLFIDCFSVWCWESNPGPHVCYASATISRGLALESDFLLHLEYLLIPSYLEISVDMI